LIHELEGLKAPAVLDTVVTNLDLARIFANEFDEPAPFSKEPARALLAQYVTVVQHGSTALIDIKVLGSQAVRAATIANEIATVYSAQKDAHLKELTERGLQALEAQLAKETNIVLRERLRDIVKRERALPPENHSAISIVDRAMPPIRPSRSHREWLLLPLAIGIVLVLRGANLLTSPAQESHSA
jgi:uncharacterized protein involved in exopolysaccharide biosynthesis